MDVEAAIRARLLAAAAVTAHVGERVYWVERIQGDAYPGITLQVVHEDRAQHLRGFQSLQSLQVQIDVWSRTHLVGKQIKDAVIETLVPAAQVGGIKFQRAFVTARDLSPHAGRDLSGEAPVFRPSLDFTFNYNLVP